MKWNDVDHEIKNMLEQPIMPPSDVWSKIERKLDSKATNYKREKHIFALTPARGIAAVLILAAITSLGLWIVNDEHAINESNVKSKAALIIAKNDTQDNRQLEENNTPTSTQANVKSQFSIHPSIVDSKINTQANNVSQLPPLVGTIPINNFCEKLNVQEIEIKENLSLAPKKETSNSKSGYPELPVRYTQDDILLTKNTSGNVNLLNTEKNYYHPEKPSLVVSAGYHYNPMLQGATVGLNASGNISKKFYYDAGIGLVVNNSSNHIEQFNGDFLALKINASKAVQNIPMSTPLFESVNNLSYITVNPSIGYKITNGLKVAVGADMQHMISQDNDVILFKKNVSQLLPKQDFGVTSNIEYDINDRVSAALAAREGVNSVITNDANVANRRYVQLLLKFKLLKKK